MKTDLDQSRHYGEVIGQGVPWKYEQDGRFFDSQGMEIHKETGQRVSREEKVARVKIELEKNEAKKKKLLMEEMEVLEQKEKDLREASEEIYINDAAANLHLIHDKIDDIKTKTGAMEVLDILGYPYDKDAHYKTLRAILEKIFDAAN